jgi:hypothetical protein
VKLKKLILQKIRQINSTIKTTSKEKYSYDKTQENG